MNGEVFPFIHPKKKSLTLLMISDADNWVDKVDFVKVEMSDFFSWYIISYILEMSLRSWYI